MSLLKIGKSKDNQIDYESLTNQKKRSLDKFVGLLKTCHRRFKVKAEDLIFMIITIHNEGIEDLLPFMTQLKNAIELEEHVLDLLDDLKIVTEVHGIEIGSVINCLSDIKIDSKTRKVFRKEIHRIENVAHNVIITENQVIEQVLDKIGVVNTKNILMRVVDVIGVSLTEKISDPETILQMLNFGVQIITSFVNRKANDDDSKAQLKKV